MDINTLLYIIIGLNVFSFYALETQINRKFNELDDKLSRYEDILEALYESDEPFRKQRDHELMRGL